MEITHDQLKTFYTEAFENGANARLVCGGLSSNPNPTTTEVYWTLVKAMHKVEENKTKG